MVRVAGTERGRERRERPASYVHAFIEVYINRIDGMMSPVCPQLFGCRRRRFRCYCCCCCRRHYDDRRLFVLPLSLWLCRYSSVLHVRPIGK